MNTRLRPIAIRSRPWRDTLESVLRVRWRLVVVARDLAARLGLLGRLDRRRSVRSDRPSTSRAQAVVPALLADLAETCGELEPETWHAHEVLRANSDLTILAAGPLAQPFRAVIKIAETHEAAGLLDSERHTLTTLHGDSRLGDWGALLPRVVGSGHVGQTAYLAEAALAGTNLEQALAQGATQESALREAADAIRCLHRATSTEEAVGAELLDRWVRHPSASVAEFLGGSRGRRSTLAAIARLSDRLCRTLDAQRVTVSWVHGDYHAENVLIEADGRVSGIVDWEFARDQDLPSLDVVTLLLTARARTRRHELGRVVCDAIGADPWTEWEAEVVASAHDAATVATIGSETLVLLCWLRHVALTMNKHRHYVDRVIWIRANIETVLDSVAHARTASR